MSSSSDQQYGRASAQQAQLVSQGQVTVRDLLASQASRLSNRLATTAQRRRQGRGMFEPGARAPIGQQLRQRFQPQGQQPQAYGLRYLAGSGAWPQIEATEPWTISADQQPQWPFGRGEIYTILSALPQIRTRAPGAAIALVRCLTERAPHPDQETERAREEIGGELARMLMRICPTPASLATASRRMAQMQQLSAEHGGSKSHTKGRLIAQYGYWEQVYILFVQGLSIGHTPDELYRELTQISSELRDVQSTGRLGFVEALRADVLLQRGHVPQADEAMFTAFGLLGKAFPDKELASLLDAAADPQLAEQVKQKVQALSAPSGGQQPK